MWQSGFGWIVNWVYHYTTCSEYVNMGINNSNETTHLPRTTSTGPVWNGLDADVIDTFIGDWPLFEGPQKHPTTASTSTNDRDVGLPHCSSQLTRPNSAHLIDWLQNIVSPFRHYSCMHPSYGIHWCKYMWETCLISKLRFCSVTVRSYSTIRIEEP